MDAAQYIEKFRKLAADRNEAGTAALAEELRRESWPTVALVAVRLTAGLARRPGSAPTPEEARWFRDRLSGVLADAYDLVKSSGGRVG